MNPTFIEKPLDDSHIYDLFSEPPRTVPSPISNVSTPNQLKTCEFKLAVALICESYNKPILEQAGYTPKGEMRVRFIFDLPEGVTEAQIKDRFLSGGFTPEIKRVFDVSYHLKGRIKLFANSGKDGD